MTCTNKAEKEAIARALAKSAAVKERFEQLERINARSHLAQLRLALEALTGGWLPDYAARKPVGRPRSQTSKH